MSDINILNKIKEVLDKRLEDIRLEKPNEEDIEQYELVRPAVYVGWIPPKNYLDEYGYDIPGIVVAEDRGIEDNDSTSLNIRLILQTYDPGTTTYVGNVEPNTKGYTDILNLITRIRLILNDTPSKLGFSVEKPIEWRFFDEQNYPYWTAYIGFNVSMANMPDINDLL